ncbi:MAG TPA: 5'-deoxyadenosine deaminase [Vicinamibacterales bacterium]|jgi:5-methylthioadenosine/S-adenosylhomocysteine deaminase|nr:5'-deoxyadenosine deaminase [Vicinamibacterales bacterium]
MSLLIRGGVILTMNDRLETLEGDVSIRDGRIARIAPDITDPHARTIAARGGYVLPGFVQTHIHLCQTLFRGFADDLGLMDWLRRRVWPMEAAHTPATLRAAVRLATTELLSSGTTTVLTMETVHDTDAVFEAVKASGMRATIGKCMMDAAGPADDVPRRLQEATRASIDESLAIQARWDGAAGGRLRAAFAPRFAVSCSRTLLEAVATLSGERQTLVHTHASESRDEIAIVRQISGGLTNMAYLADVGLASPRLCAAHCVWVDEPEQQLMAEHDIKVMHCPGSNLKLGSGVAPVAELRAHGITVSLGSDGAACNNRLDMFDEMRLAAVLQAARRQPGVLPARDVLWMATRDGARTLGLEEEIGSIEVGKRADLMVVDRDRLHLAPGPDPYSTLVYAARGTDVRTTIVDGEVLVDDYAPVRVDRADVAAEAHAAGRELATRAGIV